MKRNENESFEDYKNRRKAENNRIKKFLKGTWFYQTTGKPYVRLKRESIKPVNS